MIGQNGEGGSKSLKLPKSGEGQKVLGAQGRWIEKDFKTGRSVRWFCFCQNDPQNSWKSNKFSLTSLTFLQIFAQNFLCKKRKRKISKLEKAVRWARLTLFSWPMKWQTIARCHCSLKRLELPQKAETFKNQDFPGSQAVSYTFKIAKNQELPGALLPGPLAIHRGPWAGPCTPHCYSSLRFSFLFLWFSLIILSLILSAPDL